MAICLFAKYFILVTVYYVINRSYIRNNVKLYFCASSNLKFSVEVPMTRIECNLWFKLANWDVLTECEATIQASLFIMKYGLLSETAQDILYQVNASKCLNAIALR